jgi:hypothetical protein
MTSVENNSVMLCRAEERFYMLTLRLAGYLALAN